MDDPLDPRNFVPGSVPVHPVDPSAPFASLPTQLHDHARHLIHQGHSAEGACRQVYDSWMDSILRDWGAEFDGINPQRRIFDEDWVRLDSSHDPPTQYMHEGMRQSDFMEDLVTQTWENLGKPYHFTEDNVFRMLREALGQGEHEEVHRLHNGIHPHIQMQCIDDLLEPYKQLHSSGARAYDVYGQMPDIQNYQLPPALQPKNLGHYHQVKEDIAKHLRDRNYSNQDIFAKLDELMLDLGAGQQALQHHTLPGHVLGARWS